MATAAAMLKQKGLDVRGSDQDVYPPMSDFLAAEHIPTLSGYRAEHITSDLDLVVVGNAISRGNPELEETLDRKIRYCSLPEVIRENFLWGARSIVIAGTHGKTTTTALVGWVLTHGGVDPSVLIGGIAGNFGEDGSSYRIGHGRDSSSRATSTTARFSTRPRSFSSTCRTWRSSTTSSSITRTSTPTWMPSRSHFDAS
jgi:UDP-N-acetylmuramate: L-alanyl-gamma-D-glutamyl-meso-diaminopimelate ligase